MAFQIPFPLPSAGAARNSKVRINLDAVADAINGILTGTTSYDALTLGTANSITGTLTFYNSGSAYYVRLQPGTSSADATYTFPTALPGASSFLTSTTGGVLSWTATTTFAPNDATYVTLSTNGTLTSERVLTQGQGILLTDGGAGSTLTIDNVGVRSITGTANQVIASAATGAVTLSLPQSIATTSTVDFGKVRIDGGNAGSPGLVIYASPSATNTGLYSTGFDINFSTAGTLAGTITGTLLSMVGDVWTGGDLSLRNGSGNVTITRSPSQVSSYTLTLPANDGGANEVLSTDGTGVLSWVTPGSISGTVNSGTQYRLAYYATTGTAVSEAGAITASRALVSDTNGVPTHSTVTTTEITYVSGVTSAIQTQINAKAPTASPTFSGTITTPLTASRALVTGASSELAVSAVTATELGYVSGVTSAIQTQLGNKAGTALSNLASVAINTSLISDTNNTDDLGSAGVNWKDVHAKQVISSTAVTVTASSGGITLDPSGSNAVDVSSAKITSLANGTSSTDAAAFGQIKYIQAPQQGQKATSFSTTSSTYQATGLSATITPTSASNRIKISVSVPTLDSADASAAWAYLTVKRDSTDLSSGGNGFAQNAAGSAIQMLCPASFVYIDSPATTSAVTYQVYLKNDNNVTSVRINALSGSCVILLEEVV